MLIRGAEVEGRAQVDVRIEGGRIGAIGRGLAPRPEEEVLDAEGGALLPGLHDHHIHLLALAAASESVHCGPPHVLDRAQLSRALATATPRGGWVRGIAYHDSVAGSLDRNRLDALRSDVPIRLQHRSGALWVLNSAAVAQLGLDSGADAPGVDRDGRGRATGRLFRLDAWLRDRLPRSQPPRLSSVGSRLAGYGVTGVTDATPSNGATELAAFEAAVGRGALPQRLTLMGSPDLPAPSHPMLRRGAVKVLLDEQSLPSLEELEELIRHAHQQARAVAVHCVTRTELIVATAAFAAAGCREGDRIEHAAVASPELVELIARQPLCVVTQPHFVRERGDVYLEEVAHLDLPWLYRCRGFLDADVCLGAGTDAPFGEPDPWLVMRAAVERRSLAGVVLGAGERLDPERALALFTSRPEAPGGPPRRVVVGADADLCLLDRPWSGARRVLSSACVAATLCAGKLVWRRAHAPSRVASALV